jgi:hypothetical protein
MIIISLLSILYFSADQHCMILGIDTSDETCDEGDDAEFSQSIEEAESSRNNDTVGDNDEDDDVLVSYDESSDDESHGSRSLSTKQSPSSATVAEFCTTGQLEQLSPEDRQRIDDEIGPGFFPSRRNGVPLQDQSYLTTPVRLPLQSVALTHLRFFLC